MTLPDSAVRSHVIIAVECAHVVIKKLRFIVRRRFAGVQGMFEDLAEDFVEPDADVPVGKVRLEFGKI